MKRLELLDYGRFFAALMVIFYHYTFNGIANGKITSISHVDSIIDFSKYGYLGVELFFMISGFVIFYSAKNRSASQFAVSRAIRLYPAYWFAVLFTSVVAWYWGKGLMSVSLPQIIVNLTMFQSYLGYGHVDGVYWTLVYEVMFYAAVLFALVCGMQKSLDTIFIYWPLVMCIALLFNIQNIPYLGGYFSYFAAGALFALIKQTPNWRNILALVVTFSLCIYYSAGKAESLSASKGVFHSELVIIAIITLFFIFFTSLIGKKSETLRLPMSGILGALTYPVYLIHAHFGYMFISKFATEENKIVIYLLTLAIVFSTAFAMHQLIEVKLSSFWKRIFTSSIGTLIIKFESLSRRVYLTYHKPSRAT